MLTNIYVMYVTVCDEYDIPKTDRKSHMEFRKDIALAWINPKEYNTELTQAASMKTPTRRRRRRDEDESGVSGITLDSALQSTITASTSRPTKKLKKTRMSDDALDPVAGKLACKLDTTLDHTLIRPPNSKVRCSVYRWVGVETQKDVILCPSCDVNLCIDCYHIFHHIPNMNMMKKLLTNKYSKRK